ncbi:MAG: BamA/TamA family outer membrane protein [Pseudomonadota bacterium]
MLISKNREKPDIAIGIVRALIAVAAFGTAPLPATATSILAEQTETMEEIDETSVGLRSGSFVLAPIPFQNPVIGTGLVLGLGYLFDNGDGANTSTLGIAAAGSDNGTRSYGAVANINTAANRWRIQALAARADLNYDLFVAGVPVPLTQEGVLARGRLMFGFTPDFATGAQLRYLDTTVSAASLPSEIIPDLNIEVASAGLVLDWDTRDSDVYPRTGLHVFASSLYNEVIRGADRDYVKSFGTYDHFFAIGDRAAFGTRFALCSTEDAAPFYDACSLGGTDGFRGFSSTEFIDNTLASAQAELRVKLAPRIGMTLFAGAGSVGRTLGDLATWRQAGGVGFRYRISKQFPVDFSVDFTFNDQDEQFTYIYVGQSF